MKCGFPIVSIFLLTSGCGAPAPIPLSGKTIYSRCLQREVPVETEASVAGAYEGPAGDKRARAPGDRTPRTIRVVASKLDHPQIIVLSAYSPVIWDVSDVPAGLVRGIVAYGYYRQTVTGEPAGVPIKYVSYSPDDGRGGHESGSRLCGAPYSVYQGGPELDALAMQVESKAGAKVVRFAGGYSPATIDLGVPPGRGGGLGALFDGKRDTFPGAQRLEALVAKGVIRQATGADIEAWNAKATARLKTGELAPYRAENLGLGSSYVVLKPFTIPDGMHGANARSFIVPEGISKPEDRGSHNSYFMMGSGTCTGPDPECRRSYPQ